MTEQDTTSADAPDTQASSEETSSTSYEEMDDGTQKRFNRIYGNMKQYERMTKQMGSDNRVLMEKIDKLQNNFEGRVIDEEITKLKRAKANALENEDHTRVVEIDDQIFNSQISGTTGDEALNVLMDHKLSKEELISFSNEIDAEFREIIRTSNEFKPVRGLLQFITSVSVADHKIALATSSGIIILPSFRGDSP